jgi:hypothetical protein
MRLGSLGAGVAAWAGAVLSSLCCLLPLAIIVLGLGSGAFMAVTMQYRWILIPAGILGVGAGFVLYARERRRCKQLACRRSFSAPDGREGNAVMGKAVLAAFLVLLFLLAQVALAATSTVVLAVEGMT